MRILVISILAIIILNVACGKIEPPEMQLQPTSLNFGENQTKKTISIVNIGDERLDWYVDTLTSFVQPWMWVEPISGKNDGIVTVTVNRDNLTHGTYRGELSVKSNGGDKMIEIIMIVF